ncbi:MAG TPA: hypothetical protein VFC84_13905 [Desulfosporosinus sp.]|nr:hypothetical protein [Desulfosporosinus sp.]
MYITIKLFTSLRIGRLKSEVWEMPERSAIGDIYECLEVMPHDICFIRVNMRDVAYTQILNDQNIVALPGG